MEATVLANESAEASKCAGKYILGLIIHRGYMWFTGSGRNLSYSNFHTYTLDMHTTHHYASTKSEIGKLPWTTVGMSYTVECTLCQGIKSQNVSF
jgi:hypothetical protein